MSTASDDARQWFSRFSRAGAFFALLMFMQMALVVSSHAAMSEKQKIDALVQAVETREDLKFIRLGTEHSSSEAARMLRTKLRFAGDRVKTADQFIEHIASATQSGHPYLVRFPDGRQIPSAVFLRAELKRLTQGEKTAESKVR